MKDNSKVDCNGTGTDEQQKALEVLVSMPDKKINKLYHFDVHDKVWTAKLQVINELVKSVKDVVNYGFYDPPCNGKSGKFLDEERTFIDYPLKGSPPVLEFKCKGRVYRSMVYEPKALQKVNSKVNQRKFLEFVCSNAVGQVAKMTEKGMDPNFQDDRTGETPLSVAVTKENASDMIITLVNGGALLDYRTRDGMTPVHKAAVSGQATSVKTLLDFGASPNYKDSKGLTPLFYTVLNGGDPYCCEILLNDHSELHISDHQGMQEIHLACKNGLVQHLEHLLFYGAEIDARTASGNTALHVAALNDQDACARVLLFRGAKKNVLNYANQSAYEVAAVSGNKGLAELITNFTDKDIVKLSGKPTYSTRRRKSVSKPKASSLFPRTSSESQLSVNSDTTPPSPVSSTQSIPSITASETASIDEHSGTMNGDVERFRYPENRMNRTLSMSSTASESSESDSGELSPSEQKGRHRTWRQFSIPDTTASVPPVKAVSGAATIRKRLYASVPGKHFIAIKDYMPSTAGEIALEKGDEVEVLYVGEKGFWEGRVGNSTGWFHHSCVEEKKKGKQRPKTLFGRPPSLSSLSSSDTNGVNHVDLNNDASRTVTLQRTGAGFGFQMRGANSQVPRLNFEPTPEFPALQYFGELEKGGEAEVKGVKAGDFILEVNGEDVTTATHGHVVDLIKKGGNLVTLKIITVNSRKPSTNGTDHTDGHEMSLNDGSFDEHPSYGVDSIIAVSKENRWHSLQRQKPQVRKPVGVQMKGQNAAKRKSTSETNLGKTAYQRAQSMHNIMPPPYESIVGRRPVSGAVPVAIPHVPSDPRFSQSVSEDNVSLSKYAPTSKSTPNLDKANVGDFQNGPGSPPKDAKRNMAYNRPFSYAESDSYKPRTASASDVETVVATPVKATVVEVEASSDRKPEMTVVATPVEVIEAGAEVTSSTPKSEKPPVPPKPRSLSDVLQEAVAARTERMSQKESDTDIEPVQRSRKSSAPESDGRVSFQPADFRDRKMSAPEKFNPRKKLEASDKVRSEILTSLEEKFTEDESNGEKSPIKVKENDNFDLDKQKFTATSADIYRRYTNPTSPTRDMNRQHSLDSSDTGSQVSSTTTDGLGRQLSEPVGFDRNPSPHATPRQLVSSAPSAPPPPQVQLSDRASSSRGAAPPPPPAFIPNTSKTNNPGTAVSKGLITADALAAIKMKLKSTPNDTPVRKQFASATGDSRNFAVEHGSLLAKAVAARVARILAQSHSDTDLSAVSQSAQQANKTGNERQPSSLEKSNKSALPQLLEARAVNSRGKPSPPVAPKKRLSSPDLRHRKQGDGAGQALPFDVPAPVLSEEDKSVMMLDEVIRKEAESENWSLNSWNSGSDSSSEVFVPPPVWPSEHHDPVENSSRPWYECSSPSEESIPKASESEKFNKTITTKKGFKIQLTFETKKEDSLKSTPVTSPRTDYNEIDPVSPSKLKITDATDGTIFPKATLGKNEIISEEKGINQVKSNSVTSNPCNGGANFGLPPPPLLFTDTDEPYSPLDSPPLPPPPEFSPRGPKLPELIYTEDDDDDSSSLPSSARSNDSNKGDVAYTDISSIFSGYARPMESFMDKPVLDWNSDDVCNWLDSIKMSQYKETFRENDIQGLHLPDLTKSELKELGVKSLGHRMTLENSIAKLSQPLESNC